LDPELLPVGVAVKGPGQHLLRGDEDASMVSGSRETAGRDSISMIRLGGFGILGDGESGAKVRACLMWTFARVKF